MKKGFVLFVKSIAVLLGLILLGLLLMAFVYKLPTNRMFQHAKADIDMFCLENYEYTEQPQHFFWAQESDSAVVSYHTDSIMINNAVYYCDEQSALEAALLNPRYENGAGYPMGSLYQALNYKNGKSIHPNKQVYNPIDSFRDDTNLTKEMETMYYPRYWHGYLLYLKPLLLFFTVSEIKLISMTFQVLLTCIAVCLLFKRLGMGIAATLAATVCILNPVTMIVTFQNADIFITTLVSMIALLLFEKKLLTGEKLVYFFLIVGATTSFIDFLTYPLVSLGIPLIILVLLRETNFKESFRSIMKHSCAWALGYGGMWFGKFLLCSLVTNYNALGNGIKSLLFRINPDVSEYTDESLSYFGILKKQIMPLCNWPNLIIVLLVIITIIVMMLKGYRNAIQKATVMSLALIAAYPFAWFLVLSNHSAIHFAMTYRELAISWFALFSVLLYKWEKPSYD